MITIKTLPGIEDILKKPLIDMTDALVVGELSPKGLDEMKKLGYVPFDEPVIELHGE